MFEYVPYAQAVLAEVNKAVLGKTNEINEIMTAFLANGHVLLEDIPGVGKTTLASAFAAAMGLEKKRVQFTPDVMPSDLTGFSIYRRDEDKFIFQEGSVFTNLLLADEINRTSPKTQSALLEVMEERKVSVEGITREVPDPFLVIATQNPSGTSGTQQLPEAQVDRFMITLSLGYPDFESELEIARSVGAGVRTDIVKEVTNAEIFKAMQADIHHIFVKDEIFAYILRLVEATRSHPHIERGASPRATIALVKCAKAAAWLAGRQFVVPSDVITQLPYVLPHRIILNSTAKMGNIKKIDIINKIAESIDMPYMGAKK